jgi:hypothetical protein
MGKGNVTKAAGLAVKPTFFPECTDKHKVKGAVQVEVKKVGSLARANELKKENACRILDSSTNKWRVVKFGNPAKRSDSLAGLRSTRKGIKKRGVKEGPISKSKTKPGKTASIFGRLFDWVKEGSNYLVIVVIGLGAVALSLFGLAYKFRNKGGPKGPKGPSGGGGSNGWRPIQTMPGDGPPTLVDGPPTLVDPIRTMVAGTTRISSLMALSKPIITYSSAATAQASGVMTRASVLNKTTRTLSWRELGLGITTTAAVGLSYYLLKSKSPAASKVVSKVLCRAKP